MASLPLSSVPSQTGLLPSLSRPSTFFISSLKFRHSHVSNRLPKLHICSSTTTDTTTTVVEPNPTPTTETFDWYSQWYPLDPVCDLDKGTPKARTVMGLDVVIWWDQAAGAWKVFDDRCPHRLAPLSEGRIDQRGRLQCVYHGWCFDGAGACKYIPQAPALGPPVHKNEKACVAVYPSMVQNNILWFLPKTSPASKDIMHKTKPQYIPELDDPSFYKEIWARDLSYGYEVLTENFLDPAHLPYSHYGLFDLKQNEDPGRVQTDKEGGTPIDLKIGKSDISGFNAGKYFKFIAPCAIIMTAFTNSSKNTGKDDRKIQKFMTIALCVPVIPGKSRLIIISTWNFPKLIDKLIPRWYLHSLGNLVLDSDLCLLLAQERKLASEGISNWLKVCYVPTKSDTLVIAFRSWLKRYSNGKLNWRAKVLIPLQNSSPRDQFMDRYWSHVMHCRSCSRALKSLKGIKVSLQVISIALTGILAAANRSIGSNITKVTIVAIAIMSFVASYWLSQFINKTFYYHDYNHAIYRTDSLVRKILLALGAFKVGI